MTTYMIPAAALAPRALCGVRFCVDPAHLKKSHLITTRIRGDKCEVYVDGERQS